MITVIPYRNDKSDGVELRYAIRSIQQHFKNFSEVILVTDAPPSWFKGGTLPCKDVPAKKEYSIYRKLMCARPFTVLYTNDDFFALEDFDENLPNYSSRTCGTYRPKDPVYKRLYNNCPSEWINFDIHTPMIIDTMKYPVWSIDRPIKTTYANHNKLPSIEITDCKITRPKSKSEILEIIKDRPFFSTDQKAINRDMLEVFKYLYPNPSCCE